MYCPNCNGPLLPGSRFCQNCGVKFQASPPPPPLPTPKKQLKAIDKAFLGFGIFAAFVISFLALASSIPRVSNQGSLRITSMRVSPEADQVIGRVLNDSGKDKDLVTIKFNFKKNGVVINSGLDHISTLKAGETWEYSVRIPEEADDFSFVSLNGF